MEHIAILRLNLPKFLISGQDHQFWNIIVKINELDLLWVPNFIALEIYFIFGTKFSWNEGIDTCFNVECVLPGRDFDFCGDYLVVTARWLVVTARYLVVTACYLWLLLVTACYCSFPHLIWTILDGILSGPAALLGFNFSIILLICSAVAKGISHLFSDLFTSFFTLMIPP